MARIYHRQPRKQAPVQAFASLKRRNTASAQEECDLDVFKLIASWTFETPYPKVLNTDYISPALLAWYLGWPHDMCHQSMLNLIEDRTLEYRFDGGLEFMPDIRRYRERGEGV